MMRAGLRRLVAVFAAGPELGAKRWAEEADGAEGGGIFELLPLPTRGVPCSLLLNDDARDAAGANEGACDEAGD